MYVLPVNLKQGVLNMAIIIGLTGGIASGKSTVSNMFKQLNIPVVDADLIARQVVEPGEPAYEEIVKVFGEEILQADKTLDRKKLGAMVFADVAKRKQLNQIVHPAIRKQMLAERDAYVTQGHRCVVLDIPLLFESQLTHFVDKTIVVYVDEATQLKRLMERDQLTEQEARQRIQSQMPLAEKVKLADAVIDNNDTIEATCEQLYDLLRKWSILEE